jgi:hypothetical protein
MSLHASNRSLQDQVDFALTWLKRRRTKATLEGMARYALPSEHAYGVAMKDIKALAFRRRALAHTDPHQRIPQQQLSATTMCLGVSPSITMSDRSFGGYLTQF